MMNQRLVFDPSSQPDYPLHVQVGEPTSLYGQTRLTLEGSGEVKIEHVRGLDSNREASQMVTGKLDDPAAVFRRLADFDWQRKFPSRMGIPDEAIITWTLS